MREAQDAPPGLLKATLLRAILERFGITPGRPPDLRLLDNLVTAYTRNVPWESAFRIVKRSRCQNTADCPRWPEEFWQDALERGGGGTCFESNYAFFRLLQTLGYRGYLTVNNMGDAVGCHAAIMLGIDGQRWLADVGLPLYLPLLIDPESTTDRASPFHKYTVRPLGGDQYEIYRDRHLQPNCFTLIDAPVPDESYRRIMTADYGPDGLFLDQVIISKVIADRIWRFNSGERPLQLENFKDGRRTASPLGANHSAAGDSKISATIADRFSIDRATVEKALSIVS